MKQAENLIANALSYLALASFMVMQAASDLASQFPTIKWLTTAAGVSGAIYRAANYIQQNKNLKAQAGTQNSDPNEKG